MSAVATENGARIDMSAKELEFTLCAALLASAMLGNEHEEFRKVMRELAIEFCDFTAPQRADLIQKFTEALRS